MKGRPEFVVDARNPHRLRVRVRADVFEMVEAALDVEHRRAAAVLAVNRLAAHLRRRVP